MRSGNPNGFLLEANVFSIYPLKQIYTLRDSRKGQICIQTIRRKSDNINVNKVNFTYIFLEKTVNE